MVKAEDAEGCFKRLKELGETLYLIGKISGAGEEGERVEFG